MKIPRRDFIRLGGGAVVAWPLAARAQQGAMPAVGFLHGGSPGPFAFHAAAFRKGLGELGLVEGQNVAIEYRWVEQHDERLPALMADLIRRQVAVIAIGGSRPAVAARQATATIPIVFTTGADPVKLGLVASLNHPGGNVTGVTFFGSGEIGAKQVELLHELVPPASTMAVLVNPANPNTEGYVRDLRIAAGTLGIEIKVLPVQAASDLQPALESLRQQPNPALIVGGDTVLLGNREQIVALTARYALPAIYLQREFPPLGGLISYGTSQTDAYRLAGNYAGRILKGDKPAELPVMRPTKFELLINLNTAKSLGLTVPLTLQVAADEVIE